MKRSRQGWWWAVLVLATFALTSCESVFDLFPDEAGVTEAYQWWLGPLLAIATFTSEDLACVTAGVLASPDRGVIPYWYATLWCWIGILVGDIGLYFIGRFMGERATKVRFLRRFLSPERLERGSQWFEKNGVWVLFWTRFVPGTRVPAYVGAGAVRYQLWKFALFLGLAGMLWTPLIVGFAAIVGQTVLDWLGLYEKYALLGLVATILLIWLIWEMLVPLFTHRGRRLQLAKWYRLTEWEFWPMWAVYAPVLVKMFLLGRRHRGFFTFTAVNPGMPHSGLALESKSQILTALQGDRHDPDPRIPTWELLPADLPLEERLETLATLQGRLDQPFPIVLKPDIGERGQGVAIIRSQAAAETYLQSCEESVIAQEFVPGLEFGVFYYRYPNAGRGEIYSITQKNLVQVTGNGEDNLERLILDDPRAVRMAKFFFRKNENRLERIPEKGETVTLSDLGTHCRGAVFLDAREHITPALRDAIDELSKQFEGFYFGRYDLRVPSVEALRAGKDLRILELNGVSSEATHIYHPGYPLLQGWRDLMQQWRIAYEIGDLNREAGAQVSTWPEIRLLLREHRKREWFEAP